MNILITGGSRGIGRGIAEEAITAGHSTLLVARSGEHLSQAASALNALRPGSALSFACDAADVDELNRLLRYCTEAAFSPDCLVVNAGIFIEGTLEAASEADFVRLGFGVVGADLPVKFGGDAGAGEDSGADAPGPVMTTPMRSSARSAFRPFTNVAAANIDARVASKKLYHQGPC